MELGDPGDTVGGFVCFGVETGFSMGINWPSWDVGSVGKEMVGTVSFCGTCRAGVGHIAAQPPVLPFQIIPRSGNSAPHPALELDAGYGDGAAPGSSLGSEPGECELQPEGRMEVDSLPCVRGIWEGFLAFPALWGVIHQPLALLEPVLHVLLA